jgi:hypothetical protein
MKKLQTFSLGLIVLALCACSIDSERCTSVAQDRIYQAISADYDTATDKTSASVTLRFGGSTGTTLETDGQCAVTHDSFNLSKVNLLGTSYMGSGSGFTASHTFTFRNNDGQAFQNSGTLTSVAFSGSPPSSISKASGFTVSFTGAVGSQESVWVYLIPDSGSSVIESTSTAGATSISVSASDLALATTGSATLYLRRVKDNSLSQATSVGGRYSGTYTSAKASVSITN